MTLFLPHRETELAERMDDPDCDAEALAQTYAQFARVNSLLSGWTGIYKRALRPALRSGARTVLDVGCGGGDVLRRLASLAERDGLEAAFLGIDPDARAIDFARSQPAVPNVTFECADVYSFSRRCDLLLSNHVLHHLADAEIPAFCRASERLASVGAVHADIRRSGLALGLFPFVGGWFRGSFILEDGLRSVRRAFTVEELSELSPPGWKVRSPSPFRLELTWNAPR